ncbi:transmembrane and coiled-coil domain-containing protein 6 isoform X1 [Schistocerca cancellata]|uniref:transmembrane and coiled-coil domain-containing protein 6 isoform X1 n=1 Tax=Schistocerca cancellata TaxID=274614 RepID=UPI0021195345|nr:transmembrane and coiled-coil domain-containing protein 6 isoform X1 [Schistocerca cancellata]
METSTTIIRSNLREQRVHERDERRQEIVNHRRALGEFNLSDRIVSATEITDLANKLKCKKITLQDMKILKQALIQSEDNIRAFLNVNGALHALVREASGHKTPYKLEAINCCCNLALGNEKVGMQLTKAFAPYLISQLDCFSHVFLDICLWTLGNLAGSGEKPWSILKTQGLLPKILQLIAMGSVIQSAVYALMMYTRTGITFLEDHELESIAVESCPLMSTEPTVNWVIYLLSCTEKCDIIMLKNSVVSKASSLLLELVRKLASENESNDIVTVTALLRIIGNLCGGREECVEELMQGVDSKKHMLELFRTLLSSPYPHLRCESLWVIGNVAKHLCEPEIFLSQLEPSLSNTLKANITLNI